MLVGERAGVVNLLWSRRKIGEASVIQNKKKTKIPTGWVTPFLDGEGVLKDFEGGDPRDRIG